MKRERKRGQWMEKTEKERGSERRRGDKERGRDRDARKQLDFLL